MNAGHLCHHELSLLADLHGVHHLHSVHLDLVLVPGHGGVALPLPGHTADALFPELLLVACHHSGFLFLLVEA